jgi:CRISPR-associated protein (TIGR02584 family)
MQKAHGREEPDRQGAASPVRDPRQPHTYGKRVLLCLLGMTPAILTETVSALTRLTREGAAAPFYPTHIEVLTTTAGERALREKGLIQWADQPAWAWERFMKEWLPPQHHLPPPAVRLLADPQGGDAAQLDDLSTAQAQISAGDMVLNWVREHVENQPDCAVHASMAGGRKTLGFYLGTAMSLLGREQDRLSHVLASPAFESSGRLYPLRSEVEEAECQGVPLLSLFDVAFLRLASVVHKSAGALRPEGFRATVEHYDRVLNAAYAGRVVTLSRPRKKLIVGSTEIALPGSMVGWLIHLVWLRRNPPDRCDDGSPLPEGLPKGVLRLHASKSKWLGWRSGYEDKSATVGIYDPVTFDAMAKPLPSGKGWKLHPNLFALFVEGSEGGDGDEAYQQTISPEKKSRFRSIVSSFNKRLDDGLPSITLREMLKIRTHSIGERSQPAYGLTDWDLSRLSIEVELGEQFPARLRAQYVSAGGRSK